jgi:hypothetical protein
MTLINQVKSLVNVAPEIGAIPPLAADITNEAIVQWLKDGAWHLLMALPLQMRWEYSKKRSVPVSGLKLNGAMVLGASKHGRKAIQHTPENAQALRDSCSIYAPTLFTPAYWIQDGRAYVEPMGGEIHTISAPPITENTESIDFPIQLTSIMSYYAAMNLCTALLGKDIETLIDDSDKIDFDDLIRNPPSYDNSSINALLPSIIGSLSAAPVYVQPNLDVVYSDDVTARWLERYQDDDSEMTQEVISHIRARLEQYSLDMQNNLNAYQDDFQAWLKDVERLFQNADIQNSMAVQKEKLKVEAYSAEMQAYSVRINAYVNKWQARFGGWNAKAQLLQARYNWLREQYMTNMNLIGIGLGKQ